MVNSKMKGKKGELEFCQWLRDNLGVEARRGVQYKGDKDAPDVVTSVEGVHFEVKRTEKLNLYDALKQATKDAGENIPIVAHRRSREDWVFIVKAKHIEAFSKAIGASEKKDQTAIFFKPLGA